MEKEELLEPLKMYNSKLKDAHHQNAIDFFNDLIKKSQLNENLNIETCNKYYKKCDEIEEVAKKLNSKKALKAFLIFLTIILFVVALVFVFFCFNDILELYINIPVACICGIGGILMCIFAFKPINLAIKSFEQQKAKLEEEATSLKNEAYIQMAPLNDLYDWNIASQLFTKTCPLIEMDKFLDTKKFQYLHEKYGLNDNTDINQSTVAVQSGSILGNPFILRENFVTEMGSHTYYGSITIYWTTTESDGNGHSRTVTHSQVLTASLTKPKPFYYDDTWLIYGCDAAPRLSFSRKPSNANSMSDKEIERKTKKYNKVLDKKVKDSLTDDDPSTFTRMYNTEFEMLFNALDRDNDVEFRLLFTPLAQKSMLDLIKTNEPYGDDFYFYKRKQLNFIKSLHAQSPNFDFFANPIQFYNFDVTKARDYFVDFNDKYFKSFYFNIAPLLCIPLYQQTKSREYIYKSEYPSNIAAYEHEVAANQFDSKLFSHPETVTSSILKTHFVNKNNNRDSVEVTAYSYKTIPHIDYIPMMGRDGHMHDVPVEWYEYIPLEQKSLINVEENNQTRSEYRNNKSNNSVISVFERGILGTFIKNFDNN